MRLLVSTIAGLVALTGCVDEFETPAAYEDETFVCGTPDFDARVEACRGRFVDGRRCAGVFSVRGELQGTPITFTTELIETTLTLIETDAETIVGGASLRGPTPYFQVTLTVKSLGGVEGGSDGGVPLPRTFVLDSSASDAPDDTNDDRVEAGIRLETNADSEDLPGQSGQGTLIVTAQSSAELSGSLTGAFGAADDIIEGCFVAFPTRTIRELK
jgi:hypothetical protein